MAWWKGGATLQAFMNLHGFTEDQVKERAYKQSEFNRVFLSSTDTLIDHAKILADVSTEDEIKAALLDDEEVERDMRLYREMIDNFDPSLVKILDGMTDDAYKGAS